MKAAVLLAALAPLAALPGVQARTGAAESWITNIWNEFKEAVDCGSCQVHVPLVNILVKSYF
jgi:sphingomyelin phosphodiesterase